METKQSQAVQSYLRGERVRALKMAKNFRYGITDMESKTLIRGFECTHNPRFYEMLGYNPSEEIEKACQIFEKCFLKEI